MSTRLSRYMVRTRPVILPLAGLVFAAATLGAQAQRAKPANTALDRLVSDLSRFYETGLKANAIVGSSLLVVQDGRVVARATYGMADEGRNHPVDEDTIFHWASITKTFTAIAIMQLRDRGRLKLDDPIVKYVPELRKVHDPFGDVSEITIRHLMTHSGGFRGPTWPWGGDKPWHPFEPTEWAQIVAMLPYTEVEFQPGSRHSYSNPGIIFLGRAIEALTGDDYEVYVDKNILKPLGMYRSYFDATPYHLLPHRSASYFIADGKPQAAPFDADTGITVSNGGLNAPFGDMAKYLDFLIGNDARREVYDGVLARASLEEMFVPQLAIGTEGADRTAIGLNFFVEDREGFHLIGHSGSQNGFISHFYICPALRAGYLVNFNSEWTGLGKDEKEKTREFDSALRTWLLKNLFPALPPPRPTPAR